MSDILPFLPTEVRPATDPTAVAELGRIFTLNDKRYRVVKAAADIATADGKTLLSATSSGEPTWSMNTTTTEGSLKHLCGVVPEGIVANTTTSGTIDSGEYFMVQVYGVHGDANVETNVVTAAGTRLYTATGAGNLDIITGTVPDEGALGHSLVAITGTSGAVFLDIA